VSSILIHNTSKGLDVEIQDDQVLTKDARDSPLTPGFLFLAALCSAMEKFNSKRPQYSFFGRALLGPFQAQSIHSLVEQLEPAIASECSLNALQGLEPDQEKSPQQVCLVKLCVRGGTEDTEVDLFEGSDCKIPKFSSAKLLPWKLSLSTSLVSEAPLFPV
jgi:hypothetical protein